MKISILNLVGAQELTKNEQKSVVGGKNVCNGHLPNAGCRPNECCSAGICWAIGTPGESCGF